MMSWVLLLLLLFAGALIIGSITPVESGYVLLHWGNYSLETSIWGFLGLFILTTVMGYIVVRSGLILFGLDKRFNTWRRRRKNVLAQRQTTRGLLALAQGQWRRAERQLTQNADNSEQPLINYLAAARAALEQGKSEATDKWLRKASQSTKGSDLAVGITQVELLRSRKQYEQALAVLLRLRQSNRRHAYVLKLLVKTYRDLADWQALNELLPTIKRFTKIPAEELQQLEHNVALQLLDRHRNASVDALKESWSDLNRSCRYHPTVFARYIDLLRQGGHDEVAEESIRNAASNVWLDELIVQYGQLSVGRDEQQLVFAERQLQERPNDPYLLLTLARLCRRVNKLAKAKDYLKQGLKIKGLPELHSEMASVLVEEGDSRRACEFFQQALTNSSVV